MNKLSHDVYKKDEFGSEIINSDFSKNAITNNIVISAQTHNKNNLNDMDNRIHKINDKLNAIIKNSNIKTEETKYNT